MELSCEKVLDCLKQEFSGKFSFTYSTSEWKLNSPNGFKIEAKGSIIENLGTAIWYIDEQSITASFESKLSLPREQAIREVNASNAQLDFESNTMHIYLNDNNTIKAYIRQRLIKESDDYIKDFLGFSLVAGIVRLSWWSKMCVEYSKKRIEEETKRQEEEKKKEERRKKEEEERKRVEEVKRQEEAKRKAEEEERKKIEEEKRKAKAEQQRKAMDLISAFFSRGEKEAREEAERREQREWDSKEKAAQREQREWEAKEKAAQREQREREAKEKAAQREREAKEKADRKASLDRRKNEIKTTIESYNRQKAELDRRIKWYQEQNKGIKDKHTKEVNKAQIDQCRKQKENLNKSIERERERLKNL